MIATQVTGGGGGGGAAAAAATATAFVRGRGRGGSGGSWGGRGGGRGRGLSTEAPVVAGGGEGGGGGVENNNNPHHERGRGGRGRGRGGFNRGRGGGAGAAAAAGETHPHPPPPHPPPPSHIDLESAAKTLLLPPPSSPLIDIGCNLGHKSFAREIPAILSRSRAAGLTAVIITGTSEAASRKALEIVEKYEKSGEVEGDFPALFFTAGVHPHDVVRCQADSMSNLRRLASHPRCVAVGETGLDFNRNFSPREAQLHWFEQQVSLAVELKKPLFCHEREAFSDFCRILSKFDRSSLPPVVVHCFTGTEEELKEYISLGFYIGLTGSICSKTPQPPSYIKLIPSDRYMIETDAPFMFPSRNPKAKLFKRRNEPCTVSCVVEAIAAVRGEDVTHVSKCSTENAKRFFQIQ